MPRRCAETIVEADLLAWWRPDQTSQHREPPTTNQGKAAIDLERRAAALERLRRLQERVSARNLDLTEEQAEAIAEELSQAAIAGLVERGEISFERDRT